jgi:pimeloyl-ACP methyl ester carboxylesterase
MKNFLYDTEQIRYKLHASFEGKPYNWLFLPGGPGGDSSYFSSLVDLAQLPGNSWLIDLPGNGSNTEALPADYSFDQWIDLLVPMVKKFEHAILVGHSFGGMFPLMFPELEQHLEGFVILDSAPSLWLQEAVNYSQQFQLPDLSQEMEAFTLNPNQETFQVALDACVPYYFPSSTLELGRTLLKQLPFQFLPVVWWQRKVIELNFNAKWIPQKVPTLIINGTHDCICPYTLFEQDTRFQRPNIRRTVIQDAGHLPWVEKPEIVKAEFQTFARSLSTRRNSCLSQTIIS